jgi:hypothetical protein
MGLVGVVLVEHLEEEEVVAREDDTRDAWVAERTREETMAKHSVALRGHEHGILRLEFCLLGNMTDTIC